MTTRLGYRPALDGIRALSVIAVVLYHAHLSWIPGGFLGVEVFFVVSGFLITGILVEEHSVGGRIDLPAFWRRRARRLLPALFAMLLVVLVLTAFVATESAPDFRRDALPAVLYFSNWWQVFGVDQPYFSVGVLPVLRHLWSLAVEEQWYVVWPLAALASMRIAKRRSGWAWAACAAVVMILTAVLARVGDEGRLNFLYLGTLTRSSGLLLGAALAWWWHRRPAVESRVLQWMGVLAAVGLGALFATQHVDSVRLYRGGLAATTIASAVLVAAVVGSEGRLTRLLSWSPLTAIGRRSYGLYLWHWPLFVILHARESAARLLIAAIVTVIVDEISYRLVEMPIRRGSVRWRELDRRLVGVAAGGLLALVAVSVVKATSIEATSVVVDPSRDAVVFALPSTSVPTSAPEAAPQTSVVAASSSSPSSTMPPPTAPVLPRRVAVVGDSQAYALWINRPDGIESVFELADGSIEGCGVYEEGVGVANDGAYRRPFGQCLDFTRRWSKAIDRIDAQIALVVLGAWEVLDLRVDGMTLEVGTTTADRIFERQLRKAIDALRARGVVVALLEVPCYRPVDSWDDAIVDRGNDAHVAHLNDLMRRIVRTYPEGVHFVDGPREWCDGSPIATDLSYRYDGVHVYRRGAKLVFETIAPALLGMPVGPG